MYVAGGKGSQKFGSHKGCSRSLQQQQCLLLHRESTLTTGSNFQLCSPEYTNTCGVCIALGRGKNLCTIKADERVVN